MHWLKVTKSFRALKVFSIGLKVKPILIPSVIFLTTLEKSMCPHMVCKKNIPSSIPPLPTPIARTTRPPSFCAHTFCVGRGQRAGLWLPQYTVLREKRGETTNWYPGQGHVQNPKLRGAFERVHPSILLWPRRWNLCQGWDFINPCSQWHREIHADRVSGLFSL